MESFNQIANKILFEANEDINELHEFIQKRKSGADKIRKSSEAKGGPSKLTAIHFAAKEIPYKQALQLSTKDNCNDSLKKKGNELASRLKNWHQMSQKEFQTVMGQLEAYGEVYIKSVKPNSVKLD
jgi:gas vesicle protein